MLAGIELVDIPLVDRIVAVELCRKRCMVREFGEISGTIRYYNHTRYRLDKHHIGTTERPIVSKRAETNSTLKKVTKSD